MVIKCPNCQRVLGQTQDSLHAQLNCRGCKQRVDIRITMAHAADYLTTKGGSND